MMTVWSQLTGFFGSQATVLSFRFCAAFTQILPFPQPDKPGCIACRVSHGVPDITVSQIILYQAGVRAPFGQFLSAGMPEPMRRGTGHRTGQLARAANYPVRLLAAHRSSLP